MKPRKCENSECKAAYKEYKGNFLKNGSYKTKKGHLVQIYKCKMCGRRSTIRKKHVRRQRKPWLLKKIWDLSCRGMSQRDISGHFGCNIKTVARKIKQAAKLIREYHYKRLETVKYTNVYYDEMHSYFIRKDRRIVIGVLCSGGKVLDFSIGHFSPKDNRPIEVPDREKDMIRMFERSKEYLNEGFNLTTDGDELCKSVVKKVFANMKHNHVQFTKNEAISLGIDPLLIINNVHGSMRHRIARLCKTGQVSTRSIESLGDTLFLYLGMFNRYRAIDFQKTHIKRGRDPKLLPPADEPELGENVTHLFSDNDNEDSKKVS